MPASKWSEATKRILDREREEGTRSERELGSAAVNLENLLTLNDRPAIFGLLKATGRRIPFGDSSRSCNYYVFLCTEGIRCGTSFEDKEPRVMMNCNKYKEAIRFALASKRITSPKEILTYVEQALDLIAEEVP